MNSRRVILPLLWLAYAFMLAHELIPHHHDTEGSVAHQSWSAKVDKQTTQKPGWWFAHVHVPGTTMYQDDLDSPNSPDSPICELPAPFSFIPLEPAHWLTVCAAWPITQANAPPEPYRYRPLRAPPTFLLFA